MQELFSIKQVCAIRDYGWISQLSGVSRTNDWDRQSGTVPAWIKILKASQSKVLHTCLPHLRKQTHNSYDSYLNFLVLTSQVDRFREISDIFWLEKNHTNFCGYIFPKFSPTLASKLHLLWLLHLYLVRSLTFINFLEIK